MARFVKSERELPDVDQELEKLKKSKKKDKKSSSEKTTKLKEKETKKKKQDKKQKKGNKKEKHRILKYFKGVKNELDKVKWPSKKDMVKYSTATLGFIFFFALFFYIIDFLFALLKTGV